MKNFTKSRPVGQAWRTIPLLVLVMMLAGCRESAQPTSTPDFSTAQIDLRVEPDPPTAGQSTVIVTLTTADGEPIEGASVSIRGDMTHAGMQSVFGIAPGGSNGEYRIPFTWSMSGDWIVTVASTLPDGSSVTAEFPFTVDSP